MYDVEREAPWVHIFVVRLAPWTVRDIVMSSSPDTTDLLLAVRAGDRDALDDLVPRVYAELRRLAHRELSVQRGDGLLATTGLVHEVYLKLVDQTRVRVDDRAHFLALAARAMRHIVIDHARRESAAKRGGDRRRVPLDQLGTEEPSTADLIDMDAALRRLARFDERLHQVVECRVFGGLTVAETAAATGLSPRSVDRAWRRARAWLYRELRPEAET